MNYTENYHLPQWVKDDRIMMEDFNAAMAGIERAFTDSSAEIKQNQSAAENEDALVWNAVTRCARRLLAGQMDLNDKTRITCANGMLYHPLTSSELAGTLSGGKWSDQLGVFAGRGEVVLEDLKSACISFRGGELRRDSSDERVRSHYEFTAPLTGMIRSFTLLTKIMSVLNDGDPHLYRPALFTAKKKVNGSYSELVYQKDLVLDMVFSETATYEDVIQVEIPITKGSSYYLELRPSGSTDVRGYYGFSRELVYIGGIGTSYEHWTDESRFRIYGPPVPSVTVTRTMPAEDPATRAVAIVRFRKDGLSPDASIALNGKAMRREAAYERTDPDGEPYTETWYTYQDKIPEGDLTIQTTLTSAETDEARLLEYGVMLI